MAHLSLIAHPRVGIASQFPLTHWVFKGWVGDDGGSIPHQDCPNVAFGSHIGAAGVGSVQGSVLVLVESVIRIL